MAVLRVGALLVALVALAACAATPAPERDRTSDAVGLVDIAAALAGEFVSVRQASDDAEPTLLRVDAEPASSGVILIMTQQRAETERVFELQLMSGASDGSFDARFIPLQAGRSAAGPACDMRFRLAAGLLVGVTDPAECRFRSDGRSIGLLKEIAFEGDRVLMADQLVLEDGSLWGEPDQLTLVRVARFRGMLARSEAGHWRIARNLRLASGGNLVEPLDAAGMSLGLLLNLESVESMDRQLPALRLQVMEEGSGRVIAEVWSNLEAGMIGLGLDDLRIELQRE